MAFDPDASEREEEDELEALFMAFNEHVHEFAQERDLNDGIVSMLALRGRRPRQGGNREEIYLQAGCPHPQRLPCIFPFAQSSEQ